MWGPPQVDPGRDDSMALSPAGRARIYDDMCSGIEAVLAGRRAPVVANPDVYRKGAVTA